MSISSSTAISIDFPNLVLPTTPDTHVSFSVNLSSPPNLSAGFPILSILLLLPMSSMLLFYNKMRYQKYISKVINFFILHFIYLIYNYHLSFLRVKFY